MLFLISTRRLPDTKGSYIKLGSIWQAGSVGFNSPSWLSVYQVSSLNQEGKLSLYLEEKYMHLWSHFTDFRCIHVGIFNVGIFLYGRCLRSYYIPIVPYMGNYSKPSKESSHPKEDTCISSVKPHWLFWLRNCLNICSEVFAMPWDALLAAAAVCRKGQIFPSSFFVLAWATGMMKLS